MKIKDQTIEGPDQTQPWDEEEGAPELTPSPQPGDGH